MTTRILIVDDDQFYGQTIRDLLNENDELEFQAVYAQSAQEAYAAVDTAEVPFDIFLVDLRLKKSKEGLDVLQQLRKRSPESEAIAYTGWSNPDQISEVYEAGAFAYLPKPFEMTQLLAEIRRLLKWRDAHYERDWLRILNEVVAELQKATTVMAVARILVDGATKLEFDRARFYQVHDVDNVLYISGVCQSGHNLTLGFEKIYEPLDKTIYSKIAYRNRKPSYFQESEHGDGFLSKMEHENSVPLDFGEWVSMPLFVGGICHGILNMDNSRTQKIVPEQQRRLLSLFAGQAAAALERVVRREKERNKQLIAEKVNRITEVMGDPANTESLDRLLLAVRDEFPQLSPEQKGNFIVAFEDPETDWYYYRLQIEHGRQVKPSWRPPSKGGMVKHVIQRSQPLYLPFGTKEYRNKNEIDRVGSHPALSWIGVPLKIGEKTLGAIVLEDDHRQNTFSQEDYDLLVGLAKDLAVTIQAAWFKEQQQEFNRLLGHLQTASETVMVLAEKNEEWLWNATLVLLTADYGAGFDRAMLFMVEDGGERLQGRMAIGHLNKEDARRDWEEYVKTGTDWERYLTDLQKGLIKPTPLDNRVRQFSFAVGNSVFQDVLATGAPAILSKEEAAKRLPAGFINRFGLAESIIVPVSAGKRVIGIVVLDNIWETDPQKYGAINYLHTLTSQAALVYENRRKDQAQEQLIDVQHLVLVQATTRPLQKTLQRICESVRAIAGADLAAIYPLQDNKGELLYDHKHSARVGRRNLAARPLNHAPSGLSKHTLLEAEEPVFIPDVFGDETVYCGETHKDASIVHEEGIRAMIATPVFDPRTQRPRAIVHIDWRTPRQFTEHDRRIVESFAHLTATAISNWREAQGLRDVQEAREEELRQLSRVLEEALAADSSEKQIAKVLLEAVPTLFAPLAVTTEITLKEWQRNSPDGELVEMHRFIYPGRNGGQEKIVLAEENTSISGLVFREGGLINNPYTDGGDSSVLCVPIVVNAQVVAALSVRAAQPEAFSSHHEAMMQQRFAPVASLAINNIRRQQNLQMILRAASAITEPAKLSETLNEIKEGIKKAVPDLSTYTIWYRDPETRKFKWGPYFGVQNKEQLEEDEPGSVGMVRHAIEEKKPLWITNVKDNPRFESSKFVLNEKIKSTAVFPLRSSQEDAVGVMFLSYKQHHKFTDEERNFFPILAHIVAASIQDAVLLEQTEREKQRFMLALDVTETIGTELDQEQIVYKILNRLQQDDLFPNTTAAVLRYNAEEEKLVFTPSSLLFYFPENPEQADVSSIPIHSKTIVSAVARESLHRKQMQITNENNVGIGSSHLVIRADTKSELAISLWSEEKGLIGVLVLESIHENAFDEDAVQTARLLARQVRVAIERTLERDELEVNNTIAAATAWATEIAHDIEQEIYHIRSSVEALRNPGKCGQAAEKYLTTIDESAQRLITATPPESQSAEPFLIDNYLRTVVSALVDEIDESISLEFDLFCENLEIESYPLALKRILRHLVRNASQTMAEKTSKKIHIETKLLDEHGKLEIRISDVGSGIPPHLRHKVFRRRFPRDENGRGGLGLMLVYFLVQTIEGSIRLLPPQIPPQKNWGETFAIRLPLQPSSTPTTNPEV